MQYITNELAQLRLAPIPASDDIKQGPVNALVADTVQEIFKHLDLSSLSRCMRVSRAWRQLGDNDLVWHLVIYRSFAFNKEKWGKYYGEIVEKPLPLNIRGILKESYYELLKNHAEIEGRPVQSLFKLVAVSPTLDGQPFEAVMYGERVKTPKEGNSSCYVCFWDPAKVEHGKKVAENPYWMLITKTVVEGTRNKNFTDQKTIVASLSGFAIPKILEAIVANFTEYVETGICLYGRDPLTYTRCQESTHDHQLMVGGFGPDGLEVLYYVRVFDRDGDGVAALRKF